MRVHADIVKRNFKAFYLDMKREGERVINLPSKGKAFYQGELFYGDLPAFGAKIQQIAPFSEGGFSGGDVVVGLYSYADLRTEIAGKNYGELVVDLLGKVRWNRVTSSSGELVDPKKGMSVSLGEDTELILSTVSAWRESILKKPVSLTLGVLEGTKETGQETRKYCLEKVEYQKEVSLVARLDQPALGGRC